MQRTTPLLVASLLALPVSAAAAEPDRFVSLCRSYATKVIGSGTGMTLDKPSAEVDGTTAVNGRIEDPAFDFQCTFSGGTLVTFLSAPPLPCPPHATAAEKAVLASCN
jgi:hypothetical protein